MRVAPEIVLTDEEHAELTKLVRSELTSVRLAQRARIVLLAAEGMQNKDIAEQLGVGACRSHAGVSGMRSRGWPASSATCRAVRRRPRWTWRGWWN